MNVDIKEGKIEISAPLLTLTSEEEALDLAVRLVFHVSGDLVRSYDGTNIEWNLDSRFLKAYRKFINR